MFILAVQINTEQKKKMPFDKSLLQPCPELRPTLAEFANPIEYLSRSDILALGTKYGLVKLIPPTGWRPPFSLSPTFAFHTRVQKLSDLGITSRSRRFFTSNLNRFYKMLGVRTVKPWFVCGDAKIYYYDLYLAFCKHFGTRSVDLATPAEIASLNSLFGVDPHSQVLLRKYNSHIRAYADFLVSNGENFDFPESDPEDDLDSCLVCRKNHLRALTLLCDNCNNPYHMKCLQPPLEEVPEGPWYCDRCLVGTGAYGFEENPEIRYNIWGFVEHCNAFKRQFVDAYSDNGHSLSLDQIERLFWGLVEAENSDLKVEYGADIHNLRPGEILGFPTAETPHSPYDPHADTTPYINHPWNLTRLPFARGLLLNHINSSILGMTVPWIYVGSLLSTFCWHVEDHYTLSANYCHFGNIKKWYGIPSSHADAFEALMRESAPDLFRRQPDLLHQLVTLMSPSRLVEKGIPCVYADQGPNEFVVTFPRVYHAGFNSGFNFNEAVNFTMDAWLPFGERAIRDYREIKKENVFDHHELVENILRAYVGEGGMESWRENGSHTDGSSTEPKSEFASAQASSSSPSQPSHSFVSSSLDLTHRRELVGQCIRTYELFLDHQLRLVRELDSDRIEKTLVVRNAAPKEHIRETRMTAMKRTKAELDEDDTLCDVCRTFISYQYCEINNQHHRFGRWFRGRAKKETVISVNRLLTPTASPQDGIKTESESADLVAGSESALKLETLQERRPENDEYEELILQAKKRAAEKETPSRKRRHSNRLQHQRSLPEVKIEEDTKQATPPMKRAQYSSLLHHLNQFDTLRLCLKCTTQMCGEKGERIPRGSHLVFEKQFGDMQLVLEQAKKRYMLGV